MGDTPDANVNVIPVADNKPRNVSGSLMTGSSAAKDLEKLLKPDMSNMSKSMYSTPAQDIPGEEHDRVRPRSMSPLSPLSTSPPVSSAMLQEVKLRSRSSVKKPANENLPKETPENNELAKALDKAKRRSRKFDEKPVVDVDKPKTEVKSADKTKDIKQDSVEKVSEVNPQPEVIRPSETIVKVDSAVTNEKSVLSNPLTSSSTPVSGVSFVLKKEPLRPPSKVNVTTVTSFGENVETSSIVTTTSNEIDTKSEDKTASFKVQSSDLNKDTKSPGKDSLTESPSNKLSSPRDDYRQKRRSKTLPVTKEAIDKAEEKVQSNRNSADYDSLSSLRSTARAADIETSRTDKRASWAPATTTSINTRPEWVIRAQNKDKKLDEDKPNKPKEIKIEPSKEVKVTAKSPETPPREKPADETVTTQFGGKGLSRVSSTKQDKPVTGPSKPTSETPAFSVTAARSQFVKATPTTTLAASKPAVTITDQKPPLSAASKQASGVSKLSSTYSKDTPDTQKPPLNSAFKKPSTGSSTPYSTVQTERPNLQGAKPYVSPNKPALPGDKPVIHSVKPPTVSTTASPTASSVSKFGGVSKPADSTATRPALQKQTSVESAKPTPLSVRSAGNNNKANVVKPDTVTKEPPKIQTNTGNKTTPSVGNNENSQQSSSSSVTNKSGSVYGQSKAFGLNSNSGEGGRKFSSGAKKEIKIEIIDKDQPATAKPEQVGKEVSLFFFNLFFFLFSRKYRF